MQSSDSDSSSHQTSQKNMHIKNCTVDSKVNFLYIDWCNGSVLIGRLLVVALLLLLQWLLHLLGSCQQQHLLLFLIQHFHLMHTTNNQFLQKKIEKRKLKIANSSKESGNQHEFLNISHSFKFPFLNYYYFCELNEIKLKI